MNTPDIDELLRQSRRRTAADDPGLAAALTATSVAARTAAASGGATEQLPRRRGRSWVMLSVALGGSLLLGAGALVESWQPNYEARASITLDLPGDPFLDDGVGAPTRCEAELVFDVPGGADDRERVEEVVRDRDWSGLNDRLASLVRSDRGGRDLGRSVVSALDTELRSTLDPLLAGTARYGGVGLRCGASA